MRAFSLAALLLPILSASSGVGADPEVVLRSAPKLKMPQRVDCNSPSHWVGDKLYVFNSVGAPFRSEGTDQFALGNAIACTFDNEVNGGRWIECTWRARDGTLYGWYHFEPRGLCPGTHLTAPRIGAAKSADNGAHWTDLGVVLEAPESTLYCSAKNGYFAGGNGDFSCMLDPSGEYMYLFISTYAGSVVEQGVSVARMRWSDRDRPVGKIWKYHKGAWTEPGIGGHVTPIFTATVAWERRNADAFWGPSVHWNTHLRRYVMLLNRACCTPGWPQEGIYVSYNTDVSNPSSWTRPVKVRDGGGWYPVIIGINSAARETDKLSGHRARFYMGASSEHEIYFFNEGESATPPRPVAGFGALVDGKDVSLSWRNPTDGDFYATMIRCKTDAYPTDPNDGELVVDKINVPGTTDTYTHTGLTAGTTYYYAAFTHDVIPNYAKGTKTQAKP